MSRDPLPRAASRCAHTLLTQGLYSRAVVCAGPGMPSRSRFFKLQARLGDAAWGRARLGTVPEQRCRMDRRRRRRGDGVELRSARAGLMRARSARTGGEEAARGYDRLDLCARARARAERRECCLRMHAVFRAARLRAIRRAFFSRPAGFWAIGAGIGRGVGGFFGGVALGFGAECEGFVLVVAVVGEVYIDGCITRAGRCQDGALNGP